jgi:hypothetical protein
MRVFLLTAINPKAGGQLEKEKSSRGDARSTSKQTIMEKQVNICPQSNLFLLNFFYNVIEEEWSIFWEVIYRSL